MTRRRLHRAVHVSAGHSNMPIPTMLGANNTDRTTGRPIAYTTQNATRAPSQTIAPIAVQVLFSPATWTIRIAAAAMGNVSRKFACARFIRPTSGVGGGKAASRDDNAHFIPYWRPSSSAATYV